MLLGCIADDFTGATDIGLTLSREGMRVIQLIGVPTDWQTLPEADAVVVALKSRTSPVEQAVRQSLDAADVLLGAGAHQILFKYCSTFDSTDKGNIGPVIEALMVRLSSNLTIACPAFPKTGRTVYQGHLFVGSELLSESPMRHHPLTPMTDSNLIRLLSRQTAFPIGHIPLQVVEAGERSLIASFEEARRQGKRVLVVDAVFDRHLRAIGAAGFGLPLMTGASGIAAGLPDCYRRAGLLDSAQPAANMSTPAGRTAVLAGSCSVSTRRQVDAAIDAGIPACHLSPQSLASGEQTADDVLDWAAKQPQAKPVLIYSTTGPDEVRAAQGALGSAEAAAQIEQALAVVARGLMNGGFKRFIVAGGETSGAVVEALGVRALEIGPEIDPGVPWTWSANGPQVAMALKSGNFGAEDFFLKALRTAEAG